MENSTYLSCDGIPWQATGICLFTNIRDKLLAASKEPHINHQRLPKKLTDEALYMIYFTLVFVGLVILGTAITAYEFFFQHKEKMKESHRSGYNEGIAERRIRKSPESYDLLEGFKSFLKCFCLVQNGDKCLFPASTEGYVKCFDGVRFVGNFFVIVGHTTFAYCLIVRNFAELQYLLDWKASHLLFTGVNFLDIFFIMSGFLNAKSFFGKYSGSNGNISWISFYTKRYLSITPLYMILLGYYAILFPYTGSGKLWPTYATNPACKEDFWWNLLYISNFQSATKMCVPWCWYLAVEMQFYIISPLFMVSLIRWPRLGYALILACICGSGTIYSVLTYQHNLTAFGSRLELDIDELNYSVRKFWEYFDIAYIKPYTRITTYLVAILLAYYLRNKNLNKRTIRNSRMTLCCGWIVAIIFMWLCLFSLHKREEILMVTALYNGTKDLMFSCFLCWLTYLTLTGQLEFLNSFFSWKFFLPLSRLSYCSYLIHPIVIQWIILQAEKMEDISLISWIWMNLIVFGITYGLSFIVTLLFAIPVLNLLQLCSPKKEEKISSALHLE